MMSLVKHPRICGRHRGKFENNSSRDMRDEIGKVSELRPMKLGNVVDDIEFGVMMMTLEKNDQPY